MQPINFDGEIATLRRLIERLEIRRRDALEPIVPLRRTAERLYAERKRRADILGSPFAYSGEPAWDILLDLYISRESGRAVTISNACAASNTPATTALRWIATLEHEGMVERRKDEQDSRRVFVELTAAAIDKLECYFSAVA